MNGITMYEYEALAAEGAICPAGDGLHLVPAPVFAWLEGQCARLEEADGGGWLRWGQWRRQRVLKVSSFVGVVRAPNGFQIEVLPKVGKAIGGGVVEARQLLIDMLRCLQGFRHIRAGSAKLCAARMPLLEVFISEFLGCVEQIVKRGLRSDYRLRQDNLSALRGKLMLPIHLRQNLVRADRFFTEHDEFSTNRPENRILRAALQKVMVQSHAQHNLKLARELDFVFADIPPAAHIQIDFQQVRLDRGMDYYADALAWARLILSDEAPMPGAGTKHAPSLLFPMQYLFEAYVAKHLPSQLASAYTLKKQTSAHHLVHHGKEDLFRLKPDLLIQEKQRNRLVLDTKWKLLDGLKENGTDKYGLSQADFYQLLAYGLSYLDGKGDVVLIYPKTDSFCTPLPVFEFLKTEGLRLWVLPFCLKTGRLLDLHLCPQLHAIFSGDRVDAGMHGALAHA